MEQIGPYQILKELGRGGMGVVYRGVDTVIGRHVAIKTLRPEDMGDSNERGSMGDRLLREARSAGILSHPSIVTIYQAGQDKDILYIAMEFVDGANLADILVQGKLTVEATLKILKQSAEALDYAHSKGVVHRDIKPGNLLLEPSGKVKIADFGIAKLNQAGVTKTTSAVGSPAYMSPEHVRAQSIDGRADQYSLGVMAFEMLTGQRPHQSEELTSLVFKVVFEAPDLSLLRELPRGAELEAIFTKVLAKAADDRYASCMEFYEAFASVLEDRSPAMQVAPSTVAQPMAPATVAHPKTVASLGEYEVNATPMPTPAAAAPNRTLLYVGGGVLAVLLAVGAYFATRPNPAPPQTSGGTETPAPGDAKPIVFTTKPELIEQAQCTHTLQSEALNLHGEVSVVFAVSETGTVEDVRVTKGLHPLIDEQARKCVQAWKFKPATAEGRNVRFPSVKLNVAF
ncbi:MAG: TonB family protein [Acidobacteria bacterium]|nr:TonB family protein [Acidobacteriota bacterium]